MEMGKGREVKNTPLYEKICAVCLKKFETTDRKRKLCMKCLYAEK